MFCDNPYIATIPAIDSFLERVVRRKILFADPIEVGWAKLAYKDRPLADEFHSCHKDPKGRKTTLYVKPIWLQKREVGCSADVKVRILIAVSFFQKFC